MVLLSKVQVVALHGSDDRQSVSEVLRRVESVVMGMAKEYIEKEAAIKVFAELQELARKRVYDTPTSSPAYMRYVTQAQERDDIVRRLMAFPAADVRVNVKAEWIPFAQYGKWVNDGNVVFRPQILDAGYRCSACGTMKHKKTKWCPDCGAEIIPSAVQVELTNEDCIRNMSVEELAEGILGRICPPDRFCGNADCESFKACPACWLDWLKSPVEESK